LSAIHGDFARAGGNETRAEFGQAHASPVVEVLRNPGKKNDLDEEGPQRMLEVGDGAVGVGKGGLKMSENLRRWALGQQLGWRMPRQECRADFALAQVEPFPDALQAPVAEMAVGGANARDNAVGSGALQEPPQTLGGQAEPSDFVGAPDAESPPATRACMAIAAKNPLGSDRLSLRVALVIPAQKTMPIERANDLAMRTRPQLEPLGNRVPFLSTTAKPSFVAHPPRASENRNSTSAGEKAG
jgi:hypothetical protein